MTASDHLGPQFYHGTPAELNPGDLIEPGKHARSYPETPADAGKPRDHVYLTSRKAYVQEHYGPRGYSVGYSVNRTGRKILVRLASCHDHSI
jgi:hypothetical protein